MDVVVDAPAQCTCNKRLFIGCQIILLTLIGLYFLSSETSELFKGKAEVVMRSVDVGPPVEFMSNSELTFRKHYCTNFVSRLRRLSNSHPLKAEEKTTKDFVSNATYTLVISTYDRDLELVKNIDHWLTCPLVSQLQVLWHNPDREPIELLKKMVEEYDCSSFVPEELKYLERYYNFKRLKIRVQSENLLTNRFRVPAGGFKTEAIFNIDDDVVLDCRLMSSAFQQWTSLGESALVGFEPRQIDWTSSDQGYTWYASCAVDSCEYNTLWPTKGAFLHRSLYERYFDEEYDEPRDLVDSYLTGEDILMTYVHYSTFLKKKKTPPPILAVQATKNFDREYFNYHGRYSMAEKIKLLPGFFMDLLYIDEFSSLGYRSSWFRHHVTESIGSLAEEMKASLEEEGEAGAQVEHPILPPLVKKWYFVNDDLSGKQVNDVCTKEKLFKALRCTTYTSLYPVSVQDVAVLLSPFVFLAICAVVYYKVKAYRQRIREFETIKMRKMSGADVQELYA